MSGPTAAGQRLQAPALTDDLASLNLMSTWRPTFDWVRVHVRRLRERRISVEILRRGDRQRGAVLLKLSFAPDGWRLMHQVAAFDGATRWTAIHAEPTVNDASAEARIASLVASDPDMWILEINASGPSASPAVQS